MNVNTDIGMCSMLNLNWIEIEKSISRVSW